MSYVYFNPNPSGKFVDDCTIRAISKITGLTWKEVYLDLTLQGYIMDAMPSTNEVWGAYLKSLGFTRHVIPNTCPICYTVKDFCLDNPIGTFLLATSNHVIAVVNGNYYDTGDSGHEVPMFYWKKGD